MQKEIQKMKIYRLCQWLFVLLTWLFAILVLLHKIKSALFSIIFMILTLIMGFMYQRQKNKLIKKGVKIK